MATEGIVELIRQDHDHFRREFDRIANADADQRGELFQHLVGELARHEAAEEVLVHPTVRDLADSGRTVAEEALEEENAAEDLLARMEDMDPATPEFLDAFDLLRNDVLAHAEHEEREEHPHLASLDDGRRRALADGWHRLKETGPTRPHPHTPQTPEVRALVGPVAGLFDRARDAARDVLSR